MPRLISGLPPGGSRSLFHLRSVLQFSPVLGWSLRRDGERERQGNEALVRTRWGGEVMPYVLPTFNLAVNIWLPPAVFPPVGVPAVATIGNLTPGRRVTETNQVVIGATYLLLPALTDVRLGGVVECPAGSARHYKVMFVEDLGKGFPNEHRFVIMTPNYGTWPLPYP